MTCALWIAKRKHPQHQHQLVQQSPREIIPEVFLQAKRQFRFEFSMEFSLLCIQGPCEHHPVVGVNIIIPRDRIGLENLQESLLLRDIQLGRERMKHASF